jgi:hypothetical protein
MSYAANRSSSTQSVLHFGVIAGASALVLYGLHTVTRKVLLLPRQAGWLPINKFTPERRAKRRL